jgi:hypothetical protein
MISLPRDLLDCWQLYIDTCQFLMLLFVSFHQVVLLHFSYETLLMTKVEFESSASELIPNVITSMIGQEQFEKLFQILFYLIQEKFFKLFLPYCWSNYIKRHYVIYWIADNYTSTHANFSCCSLSASIR